MHPISTALFVLGYVLALPIATKLPEVIARRNRLAVWGHQLGLAIATTGWILRGQLLVVAGHVIWFGIVHLWYRLGGRRGRPTPAGSASPT